MKSPYKGKTGLRRLINAFGYSIAGTLAAFKHEDAFRQEVILAAILTPLALILGETAIDQALMIASSYLLLLLNY
jgi:diacylglycerol kinase (ATP)